jgi:hypothetical protein
MFWKRKTKEDKIIEKLEIKKALDVVQEHFYEAQFFKMNKDNFIFYDR